MNINKSKFYILGGLLALLVVGIPLVTKLSQKKQDIRSKASASTTLLFAPDTTQAAPLEKTVSSNVSLDAMITPGNNQISYVKLEIDYDPAKLTPAADPFTVNTNAFPVTNEGPVLQNGKIFISVSVGPDPTRAINVTTKIGTVNFIAAAQPTNGSPTTIAYGPLSQALSVAEADQAHENVISTTIPAYVSLVSGVVPTPTATPITPTPVPPSPTPTSTVPTPTPIIGTTSLEISKTATTPVIDGNLSEYANAKNITFGTPQTDNVVNARAIWDNSGLYIAYNVTDTQLNAKATTADGAVYDDDAVEWFVDTLGNGGGSANPNAPYMLADDYQGIINVLNTHYDSRGSASGTPDSSYNGNWQSAVIKNGTVNSNTDTDTGYSVETKIPWTTLGFATPPTDNQIIGLGLAIDDTDAASQKFVMYPSITTAFQNASKWQKAKLLPQAITNSPTPTPIPPTPTPAPPTPTSLPNATILTVPVFMHGIGSSGDNANPTNSSLSNKNPLHPSREVTIEILDTLNQNVLGKTGTIIYNSASGKFIGTINLGNTLPSTGSYSIKVKSHTHLKKTIPSIQVLNLGQANSLPDVTLIAGDINNDNKLNILDYNMLIDCYSDLVPAKNCTDTTKKTSADLSDDGPVNQLDYNLFVRELSVQSGQ